MDTVYNLLNRYPPSSAKNDVLRVLREIDRQSPSKKTLRAVVYDTVYAFQRLEARRLGIRADRHPLQYAEFRRNFVVALAMWVPGKDPLIDCAHEVMSKAAKHGDPDLNAELQKLIGALENRTSAEQSRRASSPRKPKSIDEYIRAALIKKPHMTWDDLWRQFDIDERGDVIEVVEYDGVYVYGITKPYSRGSIRKRYYDIRKKLKSSH